MRSSRVVLVAALAILTVDSGAAEEQSWLPHDAVVRVHARPALDIPGVVTSVDGETRWLVPKATNGGSLLVTQVEGWEEQIAMPRPGATLEGKVLSADDKGLVLSLEGRSGRFRVPSQAIESVYVRGARRSRKKQCAVGGAAGFAVGLGLAVVGAVANRNPTADYRDSSVPRVAWTFAGALAGVAVGAAVLDPGYEWAEAAPSRPVIGAVRNGAGFRLSFSF